MTRPYLIVTVLALLVVIGGGLHLRRTWQAFAASHSVASIQAEPEPPAKDQPVAGIPSQALQDWTAIAAQDPFIFDRTDNPIPPVVVQSSKPKSPKPLLSGVMSIGRDRIALLSPNAGGGRASRSLKVGEEMDGWKLVQIDDKSVIVESDAGRETLVINDPTAAIPRDHLKTMMTAAAPAPPPAPSTPPAAAQTQSAVSAPQEDSRTSSGPAKTRIEDTPFGKRVVPVPK